MSFHLKSLPADVLSTRCTVLDPVVTWPYSQRCHKVAVGVLMEQDVPEIEKMFDLSTGSAAVCQVHADRIDQFLTESCAHHDDDPQTEYEDEAALADKFLLDES